MCFHESVCATTPSPALWQEEVKAQKSSQFRVHFQSLSETGWQSIQSAPAGSRLESRRSNQFSQVIVMGPQLAAVVTGGDQRQAGTLRRGMQAGSHCHSNGIG